MSTTTRLTASIGTTAYQVSLQAREHHFLADEPIQLGGQDSAPSPDEYLLAALAACTAATLRMYADRKGYNLQAVELELLLEQQTIDGKLQSRIQRRLRLVGQLNQAEQERLIEIANKCPIHRLLSNPIHIQTSLLHEEGTDL